MLRVVLRKSKFKRKDIDGLQINAILSIILLSKGKGFLISSN